MRTLLTALFIVFATQVSAECGEMCGYEFWKKGATIADVKRAIDNGEDVNQRNSAGNGPLLWAGYYSDLDTFKFLVEQGADIHARNLNGSTALVGSKRPEIVEYLLNLGADVNPKLNDEMTIFIFQAGNDCQVESLKLLDKAGQPIQL